MTITIEYCPSIDDQFESIDAETAERIESRLQVISESPVESLDPIAGTSLYKLSVEDFQIVLAWDDSANIARIVDLSDESSDETVEDIEGLEALLTEYSELREEVRLMQDLQHRRVIGALTAIGAIMGYSLVSGRTSFIAMVPVIIGLMYVITARISNATLYLGRHLYDIEQKISIEKFGWESRFGGVIRNNERFSMWEDSPRWVVAPHLIIQILVIGVYIILVVLSLNILKDSNINPVFGFSPTSIAAICYVLIALLAALSGYSFLKVMKEIQP